MKLIKRSTIILSILFMLLPHSVFSKPAACASISKKCTKNITFDKTIDGKQYSCYECKQALCKSDGSGGLAGSKTSSVCELKGSTSRSQRILEYKPVANTSNGTVYFDEADSIYSRRTEDRTSHEAKSRGIIYQPSKRPKVNDHFTNNPDFDLTTTKPSKNKTMDAWKKMPGESKRPINVDHRNNNKKSRSGRDKEIDHRQSSTTIKPPSRVTLHEIKRNSVTISWMDNANSEYGVAIERGIPKRTSRGIDYQWKQVFKVEERIMSQVEGTGWRFDADNGLNRRTQYCYRLRAYDNKAFSNYTYPICFYTP